jgi:hypothetical protein
VTATLGVLPSRHWHIHVRQVTGDRQDDASDSSDSVVYFRALALYARIFYFYSYPMSPVLPVLPVEIFFGSCSAAMPDM